MANAEHLDSRKRPNLFGLHPRTPSALTLSALAIACILMMPLFSLVWTVATGTSDRWQAMLDTVLPRYVANTAFLAVTVGFGVIIVGTTTAWLVTMCRFPGRRVFEWALVIPLAVPAYVLAYAYTEFLSHPGPVQSLLRDMTGWGPRDYWFPRIRSPGGAAMMLTLVLYPYVYLLARASFLRQSHSAYETARTLGRTPWGAFRGVALPMARPAIAAGAALAIMETLADFGTVEHFAVQTFTTGIYRAWFSMGDRVAAAQLASVLVGFVVLVILLERLQRGKARFETRDLAPIRPAFELRGWRGACAFLACFLPLVLGFLIPVTVLAELAITGDYIFNWDRYRRFATNSFTLSVLGGVVAVTLAVLLAYARRLSRSPITLFANQFASLGYAMPGSIVAVGILIPFIAIDRLIASGLNAAFGLSLGLIFTGTIAALIFAYAVRFLAVALNAVETNLEKVSPSMDAAARTLGETQSGVLRRVHIPLIQSGLLTGFLIVFVDIMKELPATIIMRPFNFDTLAIQAYRLAADERLSEAAIPSLALVAVGIIPVIIISRQISREVTGPRL
ncbi:MAG: iron ABC transporter permease [Pseudomonadota bacterium]